MVCCFNEERALPILLERHRGYVDEILVCVDSKTTDRTFQVAKKYTDRVFIMPWEDSFGKLWNQCFKHVRTRWILRMGADEHFSQVALDNLRRLVTELGSHDGFAFHEYEKVGDKYVYRADHYRLFRSYVQCMDVRVHEGLYGISNGLVLPKEYKFYHDKSLRGEEEAKRRDKWRQAEYRRLWRLDVKDGRRKGKYR